MRRRILGVAAACLVAAGCAQLFGIDDPNEVPADASTQADGAPQPEGGGADTGGFDATADGHAGDAADGSVGNDTGAAETSSDGGQDAADSSAPSTVTGIQIAYYISELTTTPLPADFSGGITAYVASSDGGVVAYHGGPGDAGAGSFAIDGIPPGALWYVIVPGGFPTYAPQYIFTTSRFLDLSSYSAGRTDTVYVGSDAAAGTLLDTVYGWYTYDLYGASAFSIGPPPSVVTYTHGAGGLSLTPGTTGDPLTFAGTSDASFDNDAHLSGADPIYLGTALANSARGDLTYVGVEDLVDAGVQQAAAVVAGFSTSSFSMTGAGTPLSGTAQMLPMHKGADGGALIVTWDHASFLAYTGQVSSANNPAFQGLWVSVAPFVDAGGDYAGLQVYNYSLFGPAAATSGSETFPLVYADLVPAGWGHFVTAELQVKSPLTVPVPGDAGLDASSITTNANGYVLCTYPLPYSGPLQPLVGPPQGLLINGQPAFQQHTGAGLQPTLTWQAPSTTLQPTVYFISIRHMVFKDPAYGGQNHFYPAGGLWTDQTSVTVPPGILQPGNVYEFAVNSIYASNGQHAPFRGGLPACQTSTTTGIVVP
jgi:hypothetical protein